MSEKKRINTPGTVLLVILMMATGATAFVACGGGGGGATPTAPGSPGAGGGANGGSGTGTSSGNSTGTLQISMKDNPVENLQELQVYVSGLKVKPSGGPVENLPMSGALYDLLDLTNGVTALLAEAEVQAGTYQFIEILLDQTMSYVKEIGSEDELPLQIASQKIKLNGGPFEVCGGGETSVLFDFDAEKSLKQKGNGDYMLKPFLTIEQLTEGGCEPAGGEGGDGGDGNG